MTDAHRKEADDFLMTTHSLNPTYSWAEAVERLAELIDKAERRGANTGA